VTMIAKIATFVKVGVTAAVSHMSLAKRNSSPIRIDHLNDFHEGHGAPTFCVDVVRL
jgi:hypothetical protein